MSVTLVCLNSFLFVVKPGNGAPGLLRAAKETWRFPTGLVTHKATSSRVTRGTLGKNPLVPSVPPVACNTLFFLIYAHKSNFVLLSNLRAMLAF